MVSSYHSLKALFDAAMSEAAAIWRKIETCPKCDYSRAEYLQDEYDKIGKLTDALSASLRAHPDAAWQSDDDRGMSFSEEE
jgi:hypothetical protein